MEEEYSCPVCGNHGLDSFEICEKCGWQECSEQDDEPDYVGGPNHMSLNKQEKPTREVFPFLDRLF